MRIISSRIRVRSIVRRRCHRIRRAVIILLKLLVKPNCCFKAACLHRIAIAHSVSLRRRTRGQMTRLYCTGEAASRRAPRHTVVRFQIVGQRQHALNRPPFRRTGFGCRRSAFARCSLVTLAIFLEVPIHICGAAIEMRG